MPLVPLSSSSSSSCVAVAVDLDRARFRFRPDSTRSTASRDDASASTIGRGGASDATRAALDAINDRLNNARETYPQQMLLSQVRYLSSMINRADQRPGNHAYQRYEQLAAEVRTLEQQLAALDGK